MQPPLGRGTGVPPQPGPGERVLRVIEGGGQRDAPRGRVGSARRVEQRGDRLVHGTDGSPLSVEPVVTGGDPGRRQSEPQREQPPGPGEKEGRALPPGLGERHSGPDGGADEQMRTRSARDGPDGTDGSGDEPESGEEESEHDSTDVLSGVRPDEQPSGPGERGHPEPLHGRPPAPGPVIDPGEHGPDGGDDSEGGPPGQHGREQQRPGGQRSPQDRVPRHGLAPRSQGVGEPGR
ncbi:MULTISPECIES: hypothetical protein [Streptomyces]|uniref:hypothetical protein n=1 Tax=Streptomyces TaxID=1883 RepID=UPI00142E79D1